MGSVHITEIIMVWRCLLHIPQVFSNKKITNPFQRPIEKSLLFLQSILHSNISLKNWCNSFKIARGKWKKILFLSKLISTNRGNESILLLLSNNARGYKHHLQVLSKCNSSLYGFRSIYKMETKNTEEIMKHSRQNNFLATCSHQRQAALRADNKKQIQNRFDGTSTYITVTGLDEP